jgi:hypothetical protein
VTLLILPSMTNHVLSIPNVSMPEQIDVPWSDLNDSNVDLIGIAMSGTAWAHLENVGGASIGDVSQPGYVIPRVVSTNNSFGMQYPTDVAHIQCECSWVAPTFPPPPTIQDDSIVMYTSVSLESFGIEGIQSIPGGISSEHSSCLLFMVAPQSHILKLFRHSTI